MTNLTMFHLEHRPSGFLILYVWHRQCKYILIKIKKHITEITSVLISDIHTSLQFSNIHTQNVHLLISNNSEKSPSLSYRRQTYIWLYTELYINVQTYQNHNKNSLFTLSYLSTVLMKMSLGQDHMSEHFTLKKFSLWDLLVNRLYLKIINSFE